MGDVVQAESKIPAIAQDGPARSGAIAQLGERLHGMQEVSGSIPLGSTKSLNQ
jgi:hypothetical protein